MADYYCQNSSSKINDAANWDTVPAGGGTDLTWPPSSGDNLYANGKTAILINVDFDIGTGKISTEVGPAPGTAGGGFTCTSARTVTANIVAGTSSCLSPTTAVTIAWTGDLFGSATTNAMRGVALANSTIFNLTGNATGGTGGTAAYAIYVNGSASFSVSGLCLGGTAAACASNLGTGTVVDCTASSASGGAPGVTTTGGGRFTVMGNLIGTAEQGAAAVGDITYSPASATNYIQTGAGVKYYPSTNQPAAAYVIEGHTIGDGATDGTYHEATVAEVQDGVMFGAGSALEGELAAGGGGGVNMPRTRIGH